jgi:CubicO group peptidase (beta-lactamase class C family)
MEWNEEVPYDNPENSEIQMVRSQDPVEFVLSRRMEVMPGTVWNYNGGTTQLLAAIIHKVSGMQVDDFARAHLFGQLGVTKFEWITFPNTDLPAAASGLRLRSRDMLKFGLLYHQRGKWDGRRIIDESWIEASFTSRIKRPGKGGYGYQFWTDSVEVNGTELQLVMAVGNGDQRIYFDRAHDLVVVTTAGNYNKWDLQNDTFALMKNFILPAVTN